MYFTAEVFEVYSDQFTGESTVNKNRDLSNALIHGYICIYIYNYLVGGLEHILFFHILGTIIPFDSYFFRGVGIYHQPDVHIYTFYLYRMIQVCPIMQSKCNLET